MVTLNGGGLEACDEVSNRIPDGKYPMKFIVCGGLALCLTVGLTRPAFCVFVNATTAQVSVELSAADGTIQSGPTSQAAQFDDSHADPKSTSYDLQPQFLTWGGASTAIGGFASAGNGRLAVRAFATASTGPDSFNPYDPPGSSVDASAQVTVKASIYDTLTFAPPTPALNGAFFQVSTFWNVSGFTGDSLTTIISSGGGGISITADTGSTLSLSGTGVSSFYNSNPVAQSATSVSESGSPYIGDVDPPGKVPVTITGYWGVPTTIQYYLTLASNAYVFNGDWILPQSITGTTNADFSHTLAWGGISTITDGNGNPVTGWSVSSASGFDWSQPRPLSPSPRPSSSPRWAV